MSTGLSAYAGRFAAAGIVGVTYVGAALATYSGAPPKELSDRFAFQRHEIPSLLPLSGRTIRDVHPDYAHIAGWISSVGAGVAVGDLDGDGLSNDLCLVDPRTDSVTLQHALPEKAARYQPFNLTAQSLKDGPPIAPMGCILADLNADGATDVLVYYWGRGPVLFRRQGAKIIAAAYQPQEIAPGEVWNTNAALVSDLDGDGFADLMFGNYFPDGSNVLDSAGRGPVTMQHSMSRAYNGGRNRIFLSRISSGNQSGIEFADVSGQLSPEMANGWTLALGAADLTGDGLTEVYIANDFGPDRMLVNNSTPGAVSFALAEGRRGLFDIRSGVLGRDSFKGMGVDFADANGDGLTDLFVSNIAQEYALEEEHLLFLRQQGEDFADGHAPFRNGAETMGVPRSSWGWDAKFGDFNNDGRVELVQATGFVRGDVDRWPELQELAMGNDELLKNPGSWPKFEKGADLSGWRQDPFYAPDEKGVYRDVAAQVGLESQAVSRGYALADVDGDGDLDMAVARQWDGSTLYENISPSKQRALVLDLRLKNPNGTTRPAIGAEAKIISPDQRTIRGFSDLSNGHSGHRSPEIHLGLGHANGPVEVVMSWREDGRQYLVHSSLAAGRHQMVLDELAGVTELHNGGENQ